MYRSREDIQKEYDEIYLENPNKWRGTKKIDFMVNRLKAYPQPESVLDFGCGTGVALEVYSRFNFTASLYGIDISEEALKLAKNAVPYAHFTTENEFEDIKQFDLIIILGVAEHMENILEFLKELKGRLNHDGICYFEVPNNLSYSPGPATYRRLEMGSRQVEWHLPRVKWESLLARAGFKVLERFKGAERPWEFIWILA